MRRTGGFLLATSVAVAGTAGVAFLLYKNELGRVRDAASRGSLVANLDVGLIEYTEKGAGISLLSIHGAGGGFDQGLANAAELVGEGFRIVAPSRFGYLRTPVPQDTSPAAQADAHAALLSKLNVPKAVVVGVSAGARSAVELALRHPDRVPVLILVVPGLYSPTSPVSIEASRGSRFAFWVVNVGGDFAWWATEKIAPSMLIRFLGVRPALVAAAPRAERDRVMSIIKSVEPLSLRFPGINVDSTPELRKLPLEKITAPTMIISARDDLFNTLPAAEFAAGKIPGAKLVVYDTGGHLLVGHEQEVRTAVRTFLASAGLIPSSDAAATAVRK
jgi:pimeloyl-ACP methyl ester carboxylesterase